MFYSFNSNYITGRTPINESNIVLGNDIGWQETGWLPDDRKGTPIT